MTATLEWKGIPAYVIGIARGISAMVGIAATVLYPIIHSRISTLRTGLWSIWTQVLTHIHTTGKMQARNHTKVCYAIMEMQRYDVMTCRT